MACIAVEEATGGKPVPRPNRDDLRSELEQMRKAARAIPALSSEERRRIIDPIIRFLCACFLPRADAEEAAIYPKVARGFSRDVTAALVFDHLLIEGHAADLAAADPRDGARLQELLYTICALIDSHLEREQHIYLPLLLRDAPVDGALASVGR